jgi:hypothetical protein
MNLSATFRADPPSLEAQVAARLTRTLDEGTAALPHATSERLRIARVRALERAVQARRLAEVAQRPAAANQRPAPRARAAHWAWRLAGVLPLVVLAAGLVTIHAMQDDEQVAAAADFDAALLADDVPPAAYSDPGFAEFLRRPQP